MKRGELLKLIADRLTDLRLSAGGISQRELAKKAGLSAGTINRIENCKEFPRKDTLRIIARFFGTDDLLQKQDPKAIPQGPSSEKLASLRTEIENFDVIRPAPDVHIFVNPDLPLEQKQIVQEVGMELRRRLMEKRQE